MSHKINLHVMVNGIPVDAPDQDLQVARGYDQWADKGAVLDGKRVTILTEKTEYALNEEIRVVHVLEVLEPGRAIYVMGPKVVFDEYVDGDLQRKPLSEWGGDPFLPNVYNGRVQDSPGLDFNFEITSYHFSKPGSHRIWWQPGRWKSNILTIIVG
ncbi:MAG: hypothetical protein GPJ18_18450 [Microcystis aeruginosa F13-15]|jgi:hypothetical protein|nr:hypothetical protein [Microcystis aeruginosa F13-15]